MLSRVVRPSARAAPQVRSLASFAPEVPLDVQQESLNRFAKEPFTPLIQTGRLSNGIPVLSLEHFGPVSSVSVVVKAGSAYESAANRGAAHFLRRFAFVSTAHHSNVGITRGSEVNGVSFGTSSDREHIAYQATFRRDELPFAMNILGEVIAASRFRNYEVSDLAEAVAEESAAVKSDAVTLTLDGLHAAAFNTALGNSLFCDADLAGAVTSDSLRAHLGEGATAGNIAIVATGVQVADLVGAEKILSRLPGSAPRSYEAKYNAGETRVRQFTAPETTLAVGFNGASITSSDLPAAVVLRQLLGGQTSVKYGKGNSLLSKAAAGVGAEVSLDAFNLSYSTAGLFGLLVRAPSANIRAATNAATKALSSAAASVSDEALTAAKAGARAAVFASFDASTQAVPNLAAGLLAGRSSQGPAAEAAAIDAVTAADVSKFAKKLISSKASLSVTGDTAAAPLLSELSF